jgi:histidinol dehydrogenase
MTISIYTWPETSQEIRQRIFRRAEADISELLPTVSPILERIRSKGDKALLQYEAEFDGAQFSNSSQLRVSLAEFDAAEKRLDERLKSAIRLCAGNVRKFHEAQKSRESQRWMLELASGVWAGEQINPIPSVGLYVPRGKGDFPSVMYMLCTPAMVAGVPRVIVCTPPNQEGQIDDASLYTAKLCGVHEVYKLGGAQAIAAMAFGTETIPKVSKVLGPGSPYVAAAKRLVQHVVDTGMPAGPSEAIILTDESAHIQNTALDLLNEAEHGPDSAALLVTHSAKLAEAIQKLLPELIESLPEPRKSFCKKVLSGYGGIILTQSLEESIQFCNDYAVEHLHLKVRYPEQVLLLLHHAGEILIGEHTPIAMGNFGIGVNAILPTGGHARTHSATSIWDFLKRTSLAYNTVEGFHSLKEAVVTLADYEGFPAHANTVTQRDLNVSDSFSPEAFLGIAAQALKLN